MRKAQNWNQPCPDKECEMYGQMNKGNIISKATYLREHYPFLTENL